RVGVNQGPNPTSTNPNFNSTLLKFASIDIGEGKSKLDIKQLLERDFPSQRWQRNFATSKDFSHHMPNLKILMDYWYY
ncbi:hypothetical protein Godav_023309, partial [Gossypium davidsonii]|nr:hypothetical protein [Gossypium davidsonii]